MRPALPPPREEVRVRARAAIARCHPCGTTLAQSQPLAAHHRQCGQTANRRVANLAQSQPLAAHHRQCGQTASRRVANLAAAAGRPHPCGVIRSRWAVAAAAAGRPRRCGVIRNQRDRLAAPVLTPMPGPAVRWEWTASLPSARRPWYATPRDGCPSPCRGCNCPLALPTGPPPPAWQGRQVSEPLARKAPKSPGEEKPKKYIKQYEIGTKLGAGAYAKVPPHPNPDPTPRTPPPARHACDARAHTTRVPMRLPHLDVPSCPAAPLPSCRR